MVDEPKKEEEFVLIDGVMCYGVIREDDQRITNAAILRCKDCRTMVLVYDTTRVPKVYRDVVCCGRVRVRKNQ